VIYGHEVKSNDDAFLTMAEKCVWLLSNRIASSGGIWPVDIFPFLKYIPTWVPGMGFKRNAIQWKAQMEEFVEKPYNFVWSNIVSIVHLFSKSAISLERLRLRKKALRFLLFARHYLMVTERSRTRNHLISSGQQIRCMQVRLHFILM
jgi:hypothetical protein